MRITLPPWLERLLGVDTAESGEGTVWSLGYSWDWAPWITLLGALFCLGLVLVVYLREGRTVGRAYALLLAGLRIAAIAITVMMIAELVLSRQRTDLPFVAVLVDESASMGIVDRYSEEELKSRLEQRLAALELGELTRLNLAKALLLEDDAALLRGISKEFRLKLYFLAGAAREQPGTLAKLSQQVKDLSASGDASRLGTGVRAVLDDLLGTPPAAIVILTDGITTDGDTLSQAAAYAQRKSVPLFTVGLGSVDPIKNLKLHDLLVDEVVFVDDVVNFEYKLTPTGLEGRTVTVRLKEKDKPATLTTAQVTVGPDGRPQRLSLPYRPTQVGEFRYVVEVEGVPDEDQADDNREERTVNVRKEQIKVLLAWSSPNFEYRRLKEMLDRDATIELKTVLLEADPEHATADRSALAVFPVRREELFAFDAIIFGDVNPEFLSSVVMQNLVDFVEQQGRGIVFIAGPAYMPGQYRDTPLAPLLPIDFTRAGSVDLGRPTSESFVVQPTELGLASPHMQLGDSADESRQIFQNMPGLYWFLEVPHLKPAARVLAEHPVELGPEGRKLPVFMMQYVGRGKVLFHATDETWRWRYRVGDVFFARYWVQTVRYLSRSKLLGQDASAELTSDRREYRHGEAVRLRVQFFDERTAPQADDGVTVVLEQPGEKDRKLVLRRGTASRGVFEGVFTNAAAGGYHAWVASPTLAGGAPAVDFSVVAPPGEFQRVELEVEEMKAAASLSGGQFFLIPSVSELLKSLPEGRQVPVKTLEPIDLWNKWPWVVVFVLLLAAEWVLRKRRGLL